MATLSNLIVKLSLDNSQFKKGWDESARQTEGAAKKVQKSVKGINDVFNAVVGGAAGVTATLYTFKKALDFAGEGEKLIQVRNRYNALIDDIGASQSTLQGLVDITGKQVTNFDAMASAASLMELRLANSEVELQKHFEIVSRLKKPNEEFGTALENWSLLLANKSIPRLDSFGISGSMVRTRWRELTETIGDSEEAFKLAVFEEAEKAMGRLGDAVPVSSFDQFDVMVQNLNDNLKVVAAETLGPVVEGLNAFMDTQERAAAKAQELNDAVVEQAAGYGEVVEKLEKVNRANEIEVRLIRVLSGGQKAIDAALGKTARELLTVVDSYDEFRDTMLAAGIGQVEFRKAVGLTMGDFYDLNAQVIKNVTAARLSTGAWEDYGRAMRQSDYVMQGFTESMARATAGMGNYTPSAWAAAEGTRRFLEAERAAAREAANLYNSLQADFFGAIISASGISYDTLGDWTDETIRAAIKAELFKQKMDELTGKVEAGEMTLWEAAEAARNYVGSLELLKDTIENLPTLKQISINIDYNFPGGPQPAPDELLPFPERPQTPRVPEPALPPPSAGGPQGPDDYVKKPKPPTGGRRMPGMQMGGSFIVPPGFANDSYWMGVTSGEHVQVTPASKAGRGTGGDVIININGGDPARVQQVVRDELKRAGYRADSQARRR